MLRTPLYQEHLAHNGKMAPFAGWDMPLHYGSQLEEHQRVRRDVGMFDVSHMVVIDITGANTIPFLQFLLANDIARLSKPGKVLYSCMLQQQGGILDDLIVYRMSDTWCRLVVNAATADKDMAWIQMQAAPFVIAIKRLDNVAMLAVQGPNAQAAILPQLPIELWKTITKLPSFSAMVHNDWFISRTGYTGEDGFELIIPSEIAPDLWQKFLSVGIKPCGLGARDTLRLEAGMNLYGTDMDETTTPLECGLDWTVAMRPKTRNFIGRAALEIQKNQNNLPSFVGLISEGRGVLRNHQSVLVNGQTAGIITSGSFSPTLKKAIAFARLKIKIEPGVSIEVTGQRSSLQMVKPPFVRNGQPAFTYL
jgi:aminomethyltransferase